MKKTKAKNKKISIIFIMLILIMSVSIGLYATEPETTDIVCADVNLYDALVEDLDDYVYRADRTTKTIRIPTTNIPLITELKLTGNSSAKITDLTGLEYFTSLENLNLSGNSITSVEPISGLTTLKTLNISTNQATITDLNTLSNLTNLIDVNFASSRLGNVDFMSTYTQLQVLDVSGNTISSLDPLVGDIKTGSYEIKVPIENSNPNTSVQQNRRPSNYLTGDSNENNIPTGNNSEQQTQQYEIKTIEYKYWTEERYRKSIHTISNTYEEGEPITEEKINKFINLYNEYKMANAVKEEWLFQILSKNTKTANMVDLTKFLLYKATDVSYGVEEFNFSEFDLSSFSGMGGIYGSTIQEKVWFALKSLNLSDIAAAGAMGNIHYESGSFNPTAVEGGYQFDDAGIGICQWTNYPRTSGKGRHSNLIAFAESKGKEWTDENIQVEFLVAELTSSGGADGYATCQLMNSSTRYDGIKHSPDEWKNATNIETATKIFCYTFERPNENDAKKSMEKRIDYAEKYYNEFKGRTAPVGDSRIGTITLTGENASKMMAMLTEAVRIADDDRYTYSQANRYGEFQYDCSSLISRLYKKYFNFTAPSTTRGYYTTSPYYVGIYGSVELMPGDIVWKQGHVELYIGNGLLVGAHTDTYPIPDQISVVSLPKGYYTYVYRFIK